MAASLGSICLFCGSAGNVAPGYRAAAAQLGRILGEAGIRLVFGGGRVGLMGLAADACLQAGGKVIGIIPEHLDHSEIGHRGVTELRVVHSMHERKRLMAELSDAFVVLPGGLGTLDETFEILTWRQLGLHNKPVVVVDVEGYWKPLRGLIEHLIASGFAEPWVRSQFSVVERVEDVLATLEAGLEPSIAVQSERL